MSRDLNPFGLRMPQQLRSVLEGSARTNGRSLNAEIIARLEGQQITPVSSTPSRAVVAAMAMQGWISDGSDGYDKEFIMATIGLPRHTPYDSNVHFPMFVAKRAVASADALLAELAKERQA